MQRFQILCAECPRLLVVRPSRPVEQHVSEREPRNHHRASPAAWRFQGVHQYWRALATVHQRFGEGFPGRPSVWSVTHRMYNVLQTRPIHLQPVLRRRENTVTANAITPMNRIRGQSGENSIQTTAKTKPELFVLLSTSQNRSIFSDFGEYPAAARTDLITNTCLCAWSTVKNW